DLDPRVYAARLPLWERRRALAVQLRPLLDAAENASSPGLKQLDETLTALKLDFAETKKPELQPQIAKLTADRKVMVQALLDRHTKDETQRLNAEIRAVDQELDRLAKPQWVYAGADFFDTQGTFRFAIAPRPITVLLRGSVESPGNPVGPG